MAAQSLEISRHFFKKDEFRSNFFLNKRWSQEGIEAARRREVSVSYTHLDVYKRQALYGAIGVAVVEVLAEVYERVNVRAFRLADLHAQPAQRRVVAARREGQVGVGQRRQQFFSQLLVKAKQAILLTNDCLLYTSRCV